MGDGRDGLSSFDWLDRLFGFIGAASADIILPAFRHVHVGDVIPLGRGLRWPVARVEPGRCLVLEPAAGEVSWCFFLVPLRGDTTRLISRVRVGTGSKVLLWLLSPIVATPWRLMERKMLLGITRRAKARAAAPPFPQPVGDQPRRTRPPVG